MSNLSTFVKFVVSVFCTATFIMAVWNLSIAIGRDCMRIKVRKLMMQKHKVAVKMWYYIKKLIPALLTRIVVCVATMYGANLFYDWTVHTLGITENLSTLALSGMSLIIISIVAARIAFKVTLNEMKSYNKVYNTANEKLEGGLKGWLI